MIDYDQKSHWLVLVFQLRGSLFPSLYREIIAAAIVGYLAALAQTRGVTIAAMGPHASSFHSTPGILMDDKVHTILIFPLGFLLIFRSNNAYGRYMEGRMQLGKLVESVREITRTIAAYHSGEGAEEKAARTEMRRLTNVLYEMMTQQLIFHPGERDINQIRLMTTAERKQLKDTANRVPPVLYWLTRKIALEKTAGRFEPGTVGLLDNRINAMVGAWMGADKLVQTPVPYPYVQMLNALLFAYIYTVPFCLAHRFGWFTPVASVIIAVALLGINAVAMEIEIPFGTDENDLPLEGFGLMAAMDSVDLLRMRDPDAKSFTEEWTAMQLLDEAEAGDAAPEKYIDFSVKLKTKKSMTAFLAVDKLRLLSAEKVSAQKAKPISTREKLMARCMA